MPHPRRLVALALILASGVGLAACGTREDASKGNGGNADSATSPKPNATGGGATGDGAPPAVATTETGTLPSPTGGATGPSVNQDPTSTAASDNP